MNVGPDPAQTRPRRQRLRVQLGIRTRRLVVTLEVGPRVAPETALRLHVDRRRLRVSCRVAHQHAEPRLKGRRLARPGRDIVDGRAARVAIFHAVVDLGHALVGAVAGLEVQVGGPVVGHVVGEVAGGAGGDTRNVSRGHGSIKGVLPVRK